MNIPVQDELSVTQNTRNNCVLIIDECLACVVVKHEI